MDRSRRAFVWTLAGAAPAAVWLARWFEPRVALGYETLSTLPTDRECDVCIVGSGPAGAVLACALATRGIDVVVLEAGGLTGNGIAQVPGGVGFERHADGIPSRFRYPVEATRRIGPGGTSHVWGGFCPRFQPSDFTTPFGLDTPRWPISYADLEPYYVRAERDLFVAQDDSGAARELIERLANAGCAFGPVELARLGGAPVNIEESHLPTLTQSAHATVVVDARVTRLVAGPHGAITSCEVRTSAGAIRHIRARRYVLAAGGIETPRLLLASRSPEFPEGVGNQHDHVGRHFMEHLGLSADGWAGAERTEPDVLAEVYSREFYDDFKAGGFGGMILEASAEPPAFQSMTLSPILEMESSPANRVYLDPTRRDRFGNPKAAVALATSTRDRLTMQRAEHMMELVFSRMKLPSTRSDGFVSLLHHHMGTCRMAADARNGVVDAQLRVHGTSNLYVAGSAPFVTASAVPPTLTIAALSLRLADHLAQKV